MPSSNTDEIINIKNIARLLIDNVLIWLFWGSADFFGNHGHPHLSDVCFFLFYVSLTGTLGFIINAFWPHPRIIAVGCICVSVAFASLIFLASPWPSFSTDTREASPIIASIFTALMWYRISLLIRRKTAQDKAEIDRLKSEIAAARQRTDEAEKAIEAANKRAENERTAREELARQIVATKATLEPRRLTDAQQTELSNAIRAFQGQRICVRCPVGDHESHALAADFRRTFIASGWICPPEDMNMCAFLENPVGVMVELSAIDVDAQRLPAAIMPIIEFIDRHHFSKQAKFIGRNPLLSPGKIYVTVGLKPASIS